MNYLKLAQVCKINMGQSPESSTYNNEGDGLPFFQGNADFGEICPVARIWCNRPTKIAQEGDILISVRAPIGSINYATEMCCIGRGLAAITPDTKKVFSDFIYWLLKAKNAELNSKGTGSTFKAIGKKVLEEFLVPDISLEKQKEYTEVIKNTFEIIHMRQMQKRTLDNLIKARFVEMFGDPETNPKGWKKGPLADVITTANNGMARRGNGEDGNIVMRLVELQDGYIDYSRPNRIVLTDKEKKRYLLKDKDFLFARVNGNPENVGRCAVFYDIGEPVFHNDHIIRVHFDDNVLEGPFASALLNSEYGKRQLRNQIKTSAGQYTVSQDGIGAIVAILPPIEAQRQFASFVAQVDKSKVVVHKGSVLERT